MQVRQRRITGQAQKCINNTEVKNIMESPVTTIKSALNLGFILKLAVGIVLVNALLELTGLYFWAYTPVSKLKALSAKNGS